MGLRRRTSPDAPGGPDTRRPARSPLSGTCRRRCVTRRECPPSVRESDGASGSTQRNTFGGGSSRRNGPRGRSPGSGARKKHRARSETASGQSPREKADATTQDSRATASKSACVPGAGRVSRSSASRRIRRTCRYDERRKRSRAAGPFKSCFRRAGRPGAANSFDLRSVAGPQDASRLSARVTGPRRGRDDSSHRAGRKRACSFRHGRDVQRVRSLGRGRTFRGAAMDLRPEGTASGPNPRLVPAHRCEMSSGKIAFIWIRPASLRRSAFEGSLRPHQENRGTPFHPGLRESTPLPKRSARATCAPPVCRSERLRRG